jgi:hypothetical protein
MTWSGVEVPGSDPWPAQEQVWGRYRRPMTGDRVVIELRTAQDAHALAEQFTDHLL